MSRRLLSSAGAFVAAGVAVATLLAAPAGPRPVPPVRSTNATTPSSNGCPPAFADLRSRGHAEAARRETTLTTLSSALTGAQDPWGVNSGLLSTLANAKSNLVALDQRIQSSCYPTREGLRADVATIFAGYRVYWLRVPQSRIVEEADHLGVARGKLASVAQTLTGLVGGNAQAQADLTAMDHALASFDSTLGTVPNLTSHVAAVPGLVPAQDMSGNVAAMQAARADLKTARQALGQAATDAKKVVADLKH